MGVITLISDMGTTDHYVAAVKGSLLAYSPDATIVDISHNVRPFDINHAAYLLKSVWQSFPMGTVHMIGVRPELTAQQPHVVVHYMSHYFIGADNGIFSMLFDEMPEDVFEITLAQGPDWTFPMKGVFALAAGHLAKGGVPEFLGRRISGVKEMRTLQPMLEENLIKGNVVHCDHYGNVHTNIDRKLFESHVARREYTITLNRAAYQIKRISGDYAEVPVGNVMALWGFNGYLMIAVSHGARGHGGGAESLLGVKLNDVIRIEFYGNTNRENVF